jgi:hypothetical protein
VSDSLPFRQAFMLFFRQMSPHVPLDEAALRAAGIGPWPAIACIFAGLAVATSVTLGVAWWFLQHVSHPSWLLARVLFPAVLVLVQGTVTVGAYKLWLRLSPPGA